MADKNLYENAIKTGSYDIIISDFAMPNFDGITALKIAKKFSPGTPFIYVSGHIGEERAIEALKSGATDYVLKDRMIKLIPAFQRALKDIETKSEKLKIEKELKESEEKFQNIINNFPIAIYLVNKDGVITYSKGSAATDIGRRADELVGKNLLIYYNNKNFEKINGEIISGGEAFYKTLSGERQTGIIYTEGQYSQIKLLPYYEDGGEITGVMGIAYNISELMNTRNKLKKSENLYRSLFESAPIGIARVSADGKYISSNYTLQKMLEYTYEELINVNALDITHEEDVIKSKKFLEQLSMDIIQLEKRYITKSGKVIWVNITSKLIKNIDGDNFYLSMIENINDRKIAEFALKESEKRFKELTALLPQTVFELDRDLNIVYMNESGLTNFGYNNDEISSEFSIINLLDNEDNVDEKFQKVLSGESIEGLEFKAIKKDKSEFPCIVYANVIFDENVSLGIRVILIDYSEGRKTLEELVLAKEKAEEMNKLKTNFLANMSHELKNTSYWYSGFRGYSKG